MKRQKSFTDEKPALYLVATPTGNLEEMTPRAVEILKSVAVIACEDTRISGQLLKYFGISARLITCQKYNEASSAHGIVKLLKEGNSVAVISDAGYPLISDPGQKVVSAVLAEGFNVIPVSGSSALLNGLVASGLPAQPFIFAGFLPRQRNEALAKLNEYKHYPMTLVFYEAPHRITATLENFLEVFGDRKCCIGREITKFHEEFLRGTVSEMITAAEEGLKGELVIIMAGYKSEPEPDVDLSDLLGMVNDAMERGMSRSEAVKETSAKSGVAKNLIYALVHDSKQGTN